MKALSVRQPWASLIASGAKTIEVRTWRTHFRGEFVLVSSACKPEKEAARFPKLLDMPRGVTLAICELDHVREIVPSEDARAACCEAGELHAPTEFAWIIRVVRRVEQVAVKGALGFWNIDPKLVRRAA